MAVINADGNDHNCECSECARRYALVEAVRAWFKFQSQENTTTLYNLASEMFGAKFDPREYDDVE